MTHTGLIAITDRVMHYTESLGLNSRWRSSSVNDLEHNTAECVPCHVTGDEIAGDVERDLETNLKHIFGDFEIIIS